MWQVSSIVQFVCLFVFLGGTVGLNFLRSFLGFYPVYSPFSVSKCVVPNVFVLISISNDSNSYSISSGWSLQRKQVRPFSCEKKKPKSILPVPKKLPEQFRIAFHQNLSFLHIVALFPVVRVIHIPSVNQQMSFCSYIKLLIMKRPYNFIPTS